MLNPVLNLEVLSSSSKLILELTVFVQLRLVKIAVRVLLDSVSFSRIRAAVSGALLTTLIVNLISVHLSTLFFKFF